MSDNWIVQNLENALETWNDKLSEIWALITMTPQSFRGGKIWNVIVDINGAVQSIGLALLVLFFVAGVVKNCGSFTDVKKPEHAMKLFVRFALAKGAITYGMEFIMVMSFILIMTVYGRFFKLYMYTALAPIPLSTFAGEPSQNVGKSFIRSYCAVCLEGAAIALACIIFSLFASSPPVVDTSVAAVTQVWSYVGELIFNMLILVGSVKMSDRIIREMMGL